jgi:hypothetical protein
MTGQALRDAEHKSDKAKVSTLQSIQGKQSFINDQDTHGDTPLFFTVKNGPETVTGKVAVTLTFRRRVSSRRSTLRPIKGART